MSAERALGRVHRRARRTRAGRRPRRMPRRAGVGRDRRASAHPARHAMARPGEDEPGVAERVGRLADQRVASGLAEPVASADVRAQPAVDHGQPEQTRSRRPRRRRPARTVAASTCSAAGAGACAARVCRRSTGRRGRLRQSTRAGGAGRRAAAGGRRAGARRRSDRDGLGGHDPEEDQHLGRGRLDGRAAAEHHADERAGQGDDAGRLHLVEPGQERLGGAAVDDLADGLAGEQAHREAGFVLAVLLAQGREGAPTDQGVGGHRVADDDAGDRDDGDALRGDGAGGEHDRPARAARRRPWPARPTTTPSAPRPGERS